MKHRLIVLGTLASDAFAGMAWMTMQIAAGFRRLGHDVYYFETTSDWPYDPQRQYKVADADYAVPYLARVAERFGLADRWAYRRSYADKAWLGMPAARATELLATADAVFNIAGATRVAEEGLAARRLVLYGTDPVFQEIGYATDRERVRETVDEHDDVVTYGENIGLPGCEIPPLPRLRARTRQPVLLDQWSAAAPARTTFTSVGNWLQKGRDVEFNGQHYFWSKHHEFMRVIDVPRRVAAPVELATNLGDLANPWDGGGATVPAFAMPFNAREQLEANGWTLVDASRFTTDPWQYRDYILGSRGEFTVARDLNVRLRSGWFSERSACYLAAGRPVITQDTGFGSVLPLGRGLFAYHTADEAVAAFDAVLSDYDRQAAAALEIAREFFDSAVVLPKLLADLGL